MKLRWDIFCRVIDNYGDIGVCWRLARQLHNEYAMSVRLWIDDLARFAQLVKNSSADLPRQILQAIEICRWDETASDVADVVIEAFACQIPHAYQQAMAQRQRPPLWINLEYLSAEPWIETCHGLVSPHAKLKLSKYFFFPGFTPISGGLLRERDLLLERARLQNDHHAQAAFWRSLGLAMPQAHERRISLFAYSDAPVHELLPLWAHGPHATTLLVPQGVLSTPVKLFFGGHQQRGTLSLQVFPWLSQADYDRLLCLCDLNFVRGEDSLVRALWAGKPLVWQIYRQEQDAHLVKLAAFLKRYLETMPEQAGIALENFWNAWNTPHRPLGIPLAQAWDDWNIDQKLIAQHAMTWSNQLSTQPDLCARLIAFAHSLIKPDWRLQWRASTP